jgi:hypothetical protein
VCSAAQSNLRARPVKQKNSFLKNSKVLIAPLLVGLVQRPDGKVITMYYYNTEDVPAQHIAATIWGLTTVE